MARTGGYNKSETRFVDSYYSAALSKTIAGSLANPATNNSLFAVPVDAGSASGREGRCAYLKQIYIQGHITVPALTTTDVSHFYVNLWLVEDKQTNGAAMTPADFLTALNTEVDVAAFQNLEHSMRFQLHKKKMVRVNSRNMEGTGNRGACNVPFTIYKKFNDLKIQYTGSSAGIADIATSSFHLIAIVSVDASSATELQYQCRCRFSP